MHICNKNIWMKASPLLHNVGDDTLITIRSERQLPYELPIMPQWKLGNMDVNLFEIPVIIKDHKLQTELQD